MPTNIISLSLALVLIALPVKYSQAKPEEHSQHDTAHLHHGSEQAMHLNAGVRWETDVPLRQAMAELRRDVRPLMQEIHKDLLTADRYEALAQGVLDQVTYMIEHCELEGEADAQLHLVIAQLVAGANTMQSKVQGQARRDGAMRVVGALNDYATYFEDPAFEELKHQ